MNEQLFTVDELATFLKVPKSWIYSRTRQKGPGAIPRLPCGKYIRFRLDDVLEWLRKQKKEAE